jgi:hypothetical protein
MNAVEFTNAGGRRRTARTRDGVSAGARFQLRCLNAHLSGPSIPLLPAIEWMGINVGVQGDSTGTPCETINAVHGCTQLELEKPQLMSANTR